MGLAQGIRGCRGLGLHRAALLVLDGAAVGHHARALLALGPAQADARSRPGLQSPAQWSELRHLLANAARSGIEFAWVDWSCVPQYSNANSMDEVLRSKVYYARAASMAVLATFEELPGVGPVRLILGRAHRELQKLSEKDPGGKFTEKLVALALQAMLDKGTVASRDYFGRAWTLAERGESRQQPGNFIHIHRYHALAFMQSRGTADRRACTGG